MLLFDSIRYEFLPHPVLFSLGDNADDSRHLHPMFRFRSLPTVAATEAPSLPPAGIVARRCHFGDGAFATRIMMH